ncbi:hypothetical protein [Burkholderia ubonensis]|uniref:hypothetical protein n=1 Tax=Burkholderia ubonensis TaxID=101571 RepID=UPI00075408EE|nr:hypothetical protein [Burkholderia ubonensis]
MTLHNENLVERYRALAEDVVELEAIAQLAMENARMRVTHFARLAAIARYGTRVECPDIDRAVLLASIEELSGQYEREASLQQKALRAAYALREANRDKAWSQSSNVRH